MMYIYYIIVYASDKKGTNGDATLIIGKNLLSKPKNSNSDRQNTSELDT